jgi:hypothetical protein
MNSTFGWDLMTASEFGGTTTPHGPIKETSIGWVAYGHLSDLQFRTAFNTASPEQVSWHDLLVLSHEWATGQGDDISVAVAGEQLPPAAFAVTILRPLP